MKTPIQSALLLFILAGTVWPAQAAEFVPIQTYRDIDDSPFPDFGIEGALLVEDFEDPTTPSHGLSISSKNSTFVREGFSVATDAMEEDQTGMAYEALPGACTATFPMQCPATVTLEFDTDAFSQLPTFVGFVWTDAVRASASDVHPWMRINLTDATGQVSENLVNELPIASTLKSETDDDTLISFVSDEGISRVEITVMTNGMPGGGHLALDHIQYGVAALSGDTNQDGDVDFRDFLVFANEFGNEKAGWGEGDFTFDGKTTFEDLLKMSSNYGKKLGHVNQRVASVPEPTGVQLLILAVGSLLLVRRKQTATQSYGR